MSPLEQSARCCREIVDRSGSSFRRSFEFLDAPARAAMEAVYAFARLSDDLADGPTPPPVEQAAGYKDATLKPPCRMAAHLHRWIDSLDADSAAAALPMAEAALADDAAELHQLASQFDEIAASLAAAVDRFGIDREHLHELIRGAQWDLQGATTIVDQAELRRYCYSVACSVGLICIDIWRGDAAACRGEAEAAGHAFQLTNILRDVAEDARRGRIYLPADQMAACGCDRASWLRGDPSGDWQALMRRCIHDAQSHYDVAVGVLPHLPPTGQRMFSLMWTTYRELLSEIESDLDRVWSGRIRLPKRRKLQIYLAHAFTPWFERSLRAKLLRDATAAS